MNVVGSFLVLVALLVLERKTNHLYLLLESMLSHVREKLPGHWHADCHNGRCSFSHDHTPHRPCRTKAQK